MKSIKSTKLCSWLIERKLMLFVIAVSFVALALPGAFVFATELASDEASQPAIPATEEQANPASGDAEEQVNPVSEAEVIDEGVVIVTGDDEADTESTESSEIENDEANIDTVTVTGTVKDTSGNVIPAAKHPYVQIALLGSNFEPFEDNVEVTNGSFSIENVPSSVLSNYGLITAGADGYTNEILAYPGTPESTEFSFTLKTGVNCTFTNVEEQLGTYELCYGSYIKPNNGTKIELPFLASPVELGAGLPPFGIQPGAKFTENLLSGTLTYYYKDNKTNEEFNLVFDATPESGYDFNYWTINDEVIPEETGYTVTAGEDIVINPVFTKEGTMSVSAVVKDKASGQPINKAFGYLLGFNLSSQEVYVSKSQETGEDGKFVFEEIPSGFQGVVIAGAAGHTSQMLYLSALYPRQEFNLNPGVLCTVDESDNFGGVVVKAGSSIKFTDIEDEFVFPFDIDLGNDLPKMGFPNTDETSKLVFDDKGNINYSFVHDPETHNIHKMNLNLKVYGKEGYAFKNWLKDGEEFTGELKLINQKNDFTIKPCFKTAGPYTFSTYIKNHQDERITNAYAYLVGMHESTGEPYLSNTVGTDKDGVFAIENIPYDVYGIVVVGAPGYVNRFDYCDCDVEATFFTLDEGVQIDFQMPETASTVYIEKGTSVKITVDGIPLEFTLPYDIEFGNFFLPFGITPKGTFNFMEDGRASYTVMNNDNAVVINSFNVSFRVVPKDGYVFAGWLKDGQAISGEYTLQTGEKDFSITPVFVVPTPPQPTPVVDPTSPMAKTFDSIGDYFEALAILLAAFAVVYSMRKLVFKRK